MDHYYKIGNHNVHMADMLFCLGLVVVLGVSLFGLMEYTVRRDVKSMGQIAVNLRSSKKERLSQTKKSLISSDQIEEEGLVPN